jgi:hypothetical protein
MRFFTRLTIAGLLAATILPSAAQTFADPASYNNFIVNEQLVLLKKNLRYISKAAHSENERKIEARRMDVVEQNKIAVSKLQHLPAYKGNTELRNKALAAFQTTLNVYMADYKQVNALASGRNASFEAMQQYFAAQEVADKKLIAAGDSVNEAQKRFAKQFGLSIETSRETLKLSEYTRKVTEVNEYQHLVFLPFFRLQKVTDKLTTALNAQDAVAFDAARVLVAAEAEKTATELSALPAFRGKDAGYRNAARDVANMYVLLCGNQFLQVTELLRKKDTLNKVEAQTINGHINTFNTQNQKYTEAYNRGQSAFLDTYVPVMND